MPLLTTETQTLTLSANEAKALEGYLKLNRNPEEWAESFASGLNFALGEKNKERLTADMIASALLDGVDQESTANLGGLLYIGSSGTLHALTEPIAIGGRERNGEPHDLERYLTLQRSGYWLADFMDIELSSYAEGKRRTPAQVLKNLENYIAEFALNVETANEMIRDHAELLEMPIENPKDIDEAMVDLGNRLNKAMRMADNMPPAKAPEPEEEPAPSPRTSPEAWADVTIRSLEEFAKDMPEALSLDQLKRLEKLCRKAPTAPKPRNRTTSISRSRKGKTAA